MDEKLKNEFIYKQLLQCFEYYKKNAGKYDKNAKDLKQAYTEFKLKEKDFLVSKTLVSSELIKISLEPLYLSFQTTNTKIIEKSLNTWESLISKEVLKDKTLSEGMKNILKSIGEKISSINDENLLFKILNFCVSIYKSDKVIITSSLLVTVLNIFLHIYLSQKNPYPQNVAKLGLLQLLDQLNEKLERCIAKVSSNSNIKFSNAQLNTSINNNITAVVNSTSRGNNKITNRINHTANTSRGSIVLTNETIFNDEYMKYSSGYLSYLVDIIEINNLITVDNYKKDEYLKNYLEFQNISYNTEHENYEGIEKITSKYIKLLATSNETNSVYGTHGRCCNCFNPSTYFSESTMFPVCSNACESTLLKLKKSIESDKFNEINIYKDDFIIVIKTLSKLSKKETKDPNSELTGRLKEFCLEILQSMLHTGSRFFLNDEKLILVLKEYLISSLITNILASEEKIFKLSISLFLTLLSNFREHMKKEIYMFVSRVLIKILKSEIIGFLHKETTLDCFKRLSEKSNFLLEIYANFDCDINYENVFTDLMELFSKIIQGLYKTSRYSQLLKSNQELVLRTKCLNILSSFLNNLSSNIEIKDQINLNSDVIGNSEKNNIANCSNISNEDNIVNENIDHTQINQDNNNINNYTVLLNNKEEDEINDTIVDKMNQSLKIKSLYSKAVEKFNIGFKKCLEFLIKNELLATEKLFNQMKDKIMLNLIRYNNKHTNNFTNNINKDYNMEESLDNYTVNNLDNEKKDNHTLSISSEVNNDNLNNNPTSLKEKDNKISFNNFNNMLESYLYNTLNEIDKEKLSELTYEDYQANEIVKFIKQNIKEFNISSLGSFLCASKPFNKLVLIKFIDSYSFNQQHIFESMRTLFTNFKIEGEGQIVDRIMQIFGEKYTKDNPTAFANPDIAYYLGFSIMMLQTDLHREEVLDKMSSDLFINNFNLLCNGAVNREFLLDVYNRVLEEPIKMPGQKFSHLCSNNNKFLNNNSKSRKELLMKKEKENIIKSTIFSNLSNNSTYVMSSELYDFIIYIDNEHVKNLLFYNWHTFLSTFSQLLKELEDIQIIRVCLENLLHLAKLCGFLNLDTYAETFVNAIIQMCGLMEGNEITAKNFECIKALIEFYALNGIYLNVGWYGVLSIISKLEYYHNLTSESKNEQELFSTEIRKRKNNQLANTVNNTSINSYLKKTPEKEIEIEFKNAELVSKIFSISYCDNIYSSTYIFSADGIISFISALCEVSKNELSSPVNPRNFSLHKLIEVADYNLTRIQIQWAKIWKLISEHIVYVVKLYANRKSNIAIDAIDSLRQIVIKLLKKSDLAIYHFQIDFFMPFEAIFLIENLTFDKYELILKCLGHIVSSSKNIHAGWIVIFNIIKVCFNKRNNVKLNEEGIKLLDIISTDFSMISNYSQLISNSSLNNRDNLQNNSSLAVNQYYHEVFKGYIECLCHMYLDPNLKKTAFESMLNVMSKVNNKSSASIVKNNNNNNYNLTNISSDKKYEFLKVFFYGIDDLLNINLIEHLNLLFEIISYNKDWFFSNDIYSFIYLYYAYFKPCVISNLINLNQIYEKTNSLSIQNNSLSKQISKNLNSNTDSTVAVAMANSERIRDYLISLINNDIQISNSTDKTKDKLLVSESFFINGADSNDIILNFLKQISKSYEQDFELILKKNNIMGKMKCNQLEDYLDEFLDRFSNLLISQNQYFNNIDKSLNNSDNDKEFISKKNQFNYQFYYEDMVLLIISQMSSCNSIIPSIIHILKSKVFNIVNNKKESINSNIENYSDKSCIIKTFDLSNNFWENLIKKLKDVSTDIEGSYKKLNNNLKEKKINEVEDENIDNVSKEISIDSVISSINLLKDFISNIYFLLEFFISILECFECIKYEFSLILFIYSKINRCMYYLSNSLQLIKNKSYISNLNNSNKDVVSKEYENISKQLTDYACKYIVQFIKIESKLFNLSNKSNNNFDTEKIYNSIDINLFYIDMFNLIEFIQDFNKENIDNFFIFIIEYLLVNNIEVFTDQVKNHKELIELIYEFVVERLKWNDDRIILTVKKCLYLLKNHKMIIIN